MGDWQKKAALILSVASFVLLLGIGLLMPQKHNLVEKSDDLSIYRGISNASEERIQHLQDLVENLKDQIQQGRQREAGIAASLKQVEEEKQKLTQEIAQRINPKQEIAQVMQPAVIDAKPQQRVHVVAYGDTLSGISTKYYGTPKRWTEIYQANQNLIPNQNNLRLGTHLVIP